MTTGTPDTRDPVLAALDRMDTVTHVGRVTEAFGTLIRVTGVVPRIGDMCELRNPATDDRIQAEVVGISGRESLLTPLGSLEGICAGMEVTAQAGSASVEVGWPLVGRVIDAHGEPIDGVGPLPAMHSAPLYRDAPAALSRSPINRPLVTGIRAIDALLTTGEGQRMGIFAAAGGGKSTLLGMLARGSEADLNVVVLVGERGREVREFIEENLGEAGRKRSVVIVATSDRPAMERARAASLGTAVAEFFRDQGRRVVLMMDSVTRYARALRDLGLAVGEPPARRGYPPSVFSMLPRLFERAGNSDKGSITAFYTVLLEDEDAGSDPIGEEVRSILDGHVMLSRQLAARSHFPAIDVLASASRVMPRVAGDDQVQAAARLRKDLAKYTEIELLLQIGEYKPGADADADRAVERIEPIRALLQQGPVEFSGMDDTVRRLHEVAQ